MTGFLFWRGSKGQELNKRGVWSLKLINNRFFLYIIPQGARGPGLVIVCVCPSAVVYVCSSYGVIVNFVKLNKAVVT